MNGTRSWFRNRNHTAVHMSAIYGYSDGLAVAYFFETNVVQATAEAALHLVPIPGVGDLWRYLQTVKACFDPQDLVEAGAQQPGETPCIAGHDFG